ncbi:LOW QUALITY PROTEIN: uncharacterized protein LOC105425743 [Pogonomyrmex barbatus]|uniref:LOW QUALITY PROTEIN: uncharacterized protein LOC105425743 n=1 Tax=Pogonomyrmex barbatus TaxID=144034 RepID=A0A6I9W064_9HYME|nr:LOW QUALITY PROTEIN: uncharacterized protein LOC105425743 [Pogonomyrmex barbatus]
MEFLQFFTVAILLLSITSVKTYSIPYETIQQAFSSSPKLIYTSESNPAFSGYSYTTQNFNGGESNVIFTTGADSVSRLKDEINSMKMSEKYSQKNIMNEKEKNMISSEQSKSIENEISKNKQDIEILNEGKKYFKKIPEASNLIKDQTKPQRISFVDVSYPVLRENLLNLNFPVFSRYQILSNIIQGQYNPYAHLELPLHNFGFYNPTAPLFYQAAAIAIPDNNFKVASAAVENVKTSIEPNITESSQTNATSSESNLIKSNIKSRFNLESTANVEKMKQSDASMNKLESMIISENTEKEITSSKSVVTSQSSIEQFTNNKENNIEFSSTETSSLTEKSSTATEKCIKCMEHPN